MFSKLFRRTKAPTKDGVAFDSDLEDYRVVKNFELVLANMEGAPSYALTHQLTLGKQIGNIVVDDPSISERHCTFVLKDNVISIVDHGSVSGTFVNGKKIDPGKSIILEETDLILAGELEVRLRISHQRVPVVKELPKTKVEPVETALKLSELPKKKKSGFFDKTSKKSEASKLSAKGNLSLAFTNEKAANALMRVLALIGDLLLGYVVYILFAPFDEFRQFLEDAPKHVSEAIGLDWGILWESLLNEAPAIRPMLEDLLSFVSSTFHFGPILLTSVIIRLTSTLLFGVSFSQAMLALRGEGNVVWKRIGGLIREVLGLITAPLVIFDMPALISRRTFKEFMTFTKVKAGSMFVSVLTIIFYFPLILGLVVVAPLFQGLAIPEPIMVSDVLQQRVRKKEPAPEPEPLQLTSEASEKLRLKLSYDPQMIDLLPMVRFSRETKKITYQPQILIYFKDLKRSVTVEIFKTFDLRELLGMAISGNYFLSEKYGQIHDFTYSSKQQNPAFRTREDANSSRAFAMEVVALTKSSFELTLENLPEIMQTETPLIKGLVDYRQAFLNLLEYKDFNDISFVKLGNAYFFKFAYLRQKPFDLLVPLIRGEGRIYRVEYDSKENLESLSPKFYKFTLDRADWFDLSVEKTSDVLGPLQVYDFLTGIDPKNTVLDADKAQALYGYFFEKSGQMLNQGDDSEYVLWKKSVDDLAELFEALGSTKDGAKGVSQPAADPAVESTAQVETSSTEDLKQKLLQNFRDLDEAVKTKNKAYFGRSETDTI